MVTATSRASSAAGNKFWLGGPAAGDEEFCIEMYFKIMIIWKVNVTEAVYKLVTAVRLHSFHLFGSREDGRCPLYFAQSGTILWYKNPCIAQWNWLFSR